MEEEKNNNPPANSRGGDDDRAEKPGRESTGADVETVKEDGIEEEESDEDDDDKDDKLEEEDDKKKLPTLLTGIPKKDHQSWKVVVNIAILFTKEDGQQDRYEHVEPLLKQLGYTLGRDGDKERSNCLRILRCSILGPVYAAIDAKQEIQKPKESASGTLSWEGIGLTAICEKIIQLPAGLILPDNITIPVDPRIPVWLAGQAARAPGSGGLATTVHGPGVGPPPPPNAPDNGGGNLVPQDEFNALKTDHEKLEVAFDALQVAFDGLEEEHEEFQAATKERFTQL